MKPKRTQSFATRLSIWTLSTSALIFIVVIATNFYQSRQLLQNYVRDMALSTVESQVKNIESVLETAVNSADTLAALVAGSRMDDEHIRKSMAAFIKADPAIYGMAVALEPGVHNETDTGYAPYLYRKDNTLVYADLNSQDYRYQEWSWYRQPLSSGRPAWSEPYMDQGGGNIQMVTYSSPVLRDNKVIGVTTADIDLGWLHQLVRNIHIGETGYGFIVSRNDIVIAHPEPEFNMMKLVDMLDHQTIPENWKKYLDSKGDSSPVYLYTECRHNDGNCWVAIESLANTDWKVFLVLPESELISDIRSLTIKITLIAIIGLILLLIVVTHVTRRLTSPLTTLATATREIGMGQLDTPVPRAGHNDEIGLLADDFEHMRQSLNKHIEEIRKTTASKQKLESEIQIARDIQMSMIPGAGNSYIEADKFTLYACCNPARSVGGDLYYYQVDGNCLRFLIGDVSDKGVPAALFMAKTVTLFTRALRDELSPGESLGMMNDILVENNDACMFVTALCGHINLDTGKLILANAGHMNPIMYSHELCSEIEVDGATALGLMEGISYPDIITQLEINSGLVMYTDGISEAHNKDDNQYGEQQIVNIVHSARLQNTRAIGEQLVADVEEFAEGMEQFDDMTLLIVQYGRPV